MTTVQKVIKYLAIAFAIFLTVSIIGGILSAVGLFGGLFSSDAILEEVKTYSVATDIHNLDIEINAADLYIKEGDAFSVESNLKHLKVEEEGGLLTIQETKIFTGTYSGAVLTVYVPAGTVFDNVNLTTGASRLTIGNLTSGTLDFELGAGDVSIDSLVATKSADIDGGAGRITITNGTLKDLDLDMGVGQLNLTSALTGNCQLDLGVGESNITLIGTSPMAMFTRVAMSTVPWHEIAISIGILAGTTVGIGFLAAKIYRTGVLLYGTAPKIGAIIKAVWRA